MSPTYVLIMLSERSSDIAVRQEAEEIVNELLQKAHTATLYSGVSRIHLPERGVIMVMTDFGGAFIARVYKKNGYYLIEVDFGKVTEKLLGRPVQLSTLSRSTVRRYISAFLRNHYLRSYLVHEIVHKGMRDRGLEYNFKRHARDWTVGNRTLRAEVYHVTDTDVIFDTGEKLVKVRRNRLSDETLAEVDEWYEKSAAEYANNHEEVSSWLNQAVYDLTFRAKGSANPVAVIGRDAGEFVDRVVDYLEDNGFWSRYSEKNKRSTRKRAYTSYADVVRQVTSA